MTPEQKAAFIMAMAANAYAEVSGMLAENSQRISNGMSIAYGEKEFDDVPRKHGITHNQVCQFFM